MRNYVRNTSKRPALKKEPDSGLEKCTQIRNEKKGRALAVPQPLRLAKRRAVEGRIRF